MLYSYTAKSKNGEIISDVTEAADRFVAARDLRSKGYTPISIKEKEKGMDGFMISLNKLFSRIKTDEKIIFTKNLSGMIKAGLSVSRALSVLDKQTKNPSMKKVIVSLQSDINSGGALSLGLAKFPQYFSGLFVSMSKAGEESGNLSGALSEIAVNLEKANALNKKIKGALIYPGVIFSAMIIIGILMFAFVVPTLSLTFQELGVELPASTKMIIAAGDFFSNNLFLTFVILFAAVLGLVATIRAKFSAKYIDYMVTHLPVIGKIDQEINTARTARTMSSLLSSGVSITRAIEITKDVVQNMYYRQVLDTARANVEKGEAFSKAFSVRTDLYPVMMSEMVQVGEETGKLSDMLMEVANFYEKEIENKTKNLSTVIEPFLMVFIGGSVGFFAISMISPLYSILENIG